MPAEPRIDHPGVHLPPPLLFVAGFLLGWLVETRVLRLRLVGGSADPRAVRIVGALLLAAGVALSAWGMLTFWRARTAILPFRPASRLVEAGPYRFTRNPMYTGMTLAYLGLALVENMVWPIVVLPVVLGALFLLVIRREERYLTQLFGDGYAEYRRRVGRWL